jgi:hypothetical protein
MGENKGFRTTSRTVVGPWLIVVDAMDYDTACTLGKLMGAHGVTGTFLTGTIAQNLGDYSKLKRKLKNEGK